ncbi:hypothetical protein TVAG_463230 [Trichomonas vaginalis G3]|uniref:Uncharacterized protein n=1 Tax=Trichomonas vaginalis (strain ATCC PRA-98 / G3) TaxID=412133 RepID=A2EGZ5_TRIV3|nr:hypothetical protein TVAGG3_0078140 [Trichomonas vaginalis G3]EAY08043.1 hypothetical protein TVAG_463230 [Trichomonas vaginalis G3]KAI5543043.1 hypothetical protein TVAGG3_0078140 [Trichomonas vaginalis G3]|eukprot:XP_001320266.1 hypothetical protein [Trichomonas vaginalis G3]
MASKNARNIGLIILKNLGLTDEEAEVLENQKPEQINTIFARDQSGLGYKKLSTNYAAEANNVFARISAKIANDNKDQVKTCIASTATKTHQFIPRRLQKKSIGSLSNEDLATILSEVAPTTAQTSQITTSTPEEPAKRKRRHHHHHATEEQ